MKNPAIEIDIASIQASDFIDAHSGCYQQTKESCKRAGTESLGRRQLLRSAEDSVDLLVGVDVRGLTSMMIRKKACRGDLSARFNGAIPDGEASNHTQTCGPAGRLSFGRLRGPAKCQFRGDV